MKKKFYLRLLPNFLKPAKPSQLSSLLSGNTNRNDIYELLDEYFYAHLPLEFVKHRHYFSQHGRGFGENAFHSMWYLLFSEFRPVNCLEIGVYRGQVITLWGLLANHLHYQCHVHCISPFTSEGDSVSKYSDSVDYLNDTLMNHRYFHLDDPTIFVGLSNSPEAKEFISSKKWDLIYIDGSHEYDIARSDLETSISNLERNGIIIMDDSSLYFDYKPGKGAFAGHPGPSRVAKEASEGTLKLLGGIGHNNIFVLP